MQKIRKKISTGLKYFNKKIKSIAVNPYPKEGQIIKFKNQYISIAFEN